MRHSKRAQRAERLQQMKNARQIAARERRRAKLERRRALRAEQARASILVPDGATPAAEQRVVGSRLAYSLHDLQQKNLRELQHAAKGLGIKKYSGLKKGDLIEYIYQHPSNLTVEYA